MPEMILPGTYIEVRAEGLIRPGPVSTGNVGIVGTASRGLLGYEENPNDEARVYTPAGIGEAREIFGTPDPHDDPIEPGHELTLVRAMELAFDNGASRIFAVRVAAAGAARATYQLAAASSTSLTFTARAPGQGYDGARITTGAHTLELDVSVAGAGGAQLERVGPLSRNTVQDFVDAINAGSSLLTASTTGNPAGPIPMGAATLATPGTAAVAAVFNVSTAAGQGVNLTALTPGAAANAATITIAAGSAADLCNVTIDSGTGTTETFNDVPRATDDFVATLNGTNAAYDYATNASTGGPSQLFIAEDQSGGSDVEDGAAANSTQGVDAVAAVFEITAGPGTVQLTARTAGTGPNGWTVDIDGRVDVSVDLAGVIETWRGVSTDPARFAAVLNGTDPDYDFRTRASTGGGSALFTIAAGAATAPVAENATASATGGGANGADATPTDYESGLEALLDQDVQIVVLAGEGAPDMTSALQSHVQRASTDVIKRERIGVIGSVNSARRTDLVAPAQDEGRLVFVGPGLQTTEASGLSVTLNGTYTAAAVAGLVSSLDPHASPTNKTIVTDGLQTVFNGTDLEQLVLGRVLALEMKRGAVRVVRGITSSTNTAWTQITTRRIVDFARNGTRAAADPFIGKLNNERVRNALKGSINSFLADMVDREMLVEYQLDVSATRDQQIRGIAQVTMVLMPTFSIDYIRVVMYLQ